MYKAAKIEKMMQKARKSSNFSILGLESKGVKFGQATLLRAYWPVICQILVNLHEFCSLSLPKMDEFRGFSYLSSVVLTRKICIISNFAPASRSRKEQIRSILSMSFDCKYPCDVTDWLLAPVGFLLCLCLLKSS